MPPPARPGDGARIAALDLIRGVAVLGILAVNIAGFAGPMISATTPHWPHQGTRLDEIAYAFTLVLFEGKMRTLFTVLFGASMLLFLERAEAAGKDAPRLQLRRLGWLLLFGYLHFALLWWGDILFTYALCGFFAMMFRQMTAKPLAAAALILFATYHVHGMVQTLPEITAEEQVRTGTASAEQVTAYGEDIADRRERMEDELAVYESGWQAQARDKLTERRFFPLAMAIASFFETLPLMLLGMTLYRSGFFSGGWPRRRLLAVAVGGLVAGGIPTLVAAAWSMARHFPPVAMNALLSKWLALPHLLMALGYAALLMLSAPSLLRTAFGRRLGAAGQTAFSNYLGTSLVMTGIFYGWGLGLIGEVGAAEQWLYVLLGWALMLAWSKPWLARFRQGPLEWLWRSLTEWRVLPLRR